MRYLWKKTRKKKSHHFIWWYRLQSALVQRYNSNELRHFLVSVRDPVDRWNILADDWRHCHGRGERLSSVPLMPLIANLIFPSASHAMVRRNRNCRWAFQIPYPGSYARTSRSLPVEFRIAFKFLITLKMFVRKIRRVLKNRALLMHWWHVKQSTGSL